MNNKIDELTDKLKKEISWKINVVFIAFIIAIPIAQIAAYFLARVITGLIAEGGLIK